MSEQSQNEVIKSKEITVGGIPMPVYMSSEDEYRWSMRQASKAVGFNEGWLSDTLRATNSNVLIKLKGYGFQGEIVEYQGKGFIESNLISTEDFMAMIMYAAVVGMRRQAIALLAAAMHETLERRADHAFGVVRDEDEYIQKFEFRHASILLNKDLRAAIGEWIENNKETLRDYTRKHSIRGGQRGIYASALGLIYKLLFGRQKKEINELLDVKYYETPKNNVHVQQLQSIANIEALAAKYIQRKSMGPMESIEAAAEALMIEPEEPRLGDRITPNDVYKVLDSKSNSKSS